MKTARELMKYAAERDDWKHLKLWTWAYAYEEKAREWNDITPPVSDDRRVYINTYSQVYEAIDSLQDNPPAWVCCAINHELRIEEARMNDIIARFELLRNSRKEVK